MSNLIAFFTVEASDERFVSGSVDKTAIVWKKDGDYEVRYGQLLCSLIQDSYKCLAGTIIVPDSRVCTIHLKF